MSTLTKTEAAIFSKEIVPTVDLLDGIIAERAKVSLESFDKQRGSPNESVEGKLQNLAWLVESQAYSVLFEAAVSREYGRAAGWMAQDNGMEFHLRARFKELLQQGFAPNSTSAMANIRNLAMHEARQHVYIVLSGERQ